MQVCKNYYALTKEKVNAQNFRPNVKQVEKIAIICYINKGIF